MNWRFWKRAEPQKPAPLKLPFLYMEVHPDGRLYVESGWPKPAEGEQGQEEVQTYGAMVALLCNGRLLPNLQEAIAVAGVNSGTEGHAKGILGFINECLKRDGVKDDDKLVVSPERAFDERDREGD